METASTWRKCERKRKKSVSIKEGKKRRKGIVFQPPPRAEEVQKKGYR